MVEFTVFEVVETTETDGMVVEIYEPVINNEEDQ